MSKIPVTFPSLSWTPGASSWQTLITALQRMFQLIAGAINNPDAGPSGARPTQQLVVGQPFFNTGSDEPEWWNGTEWVSAAGSVAPAGPTYVTSGHVLVANVPTATFLNLASITLPAGTWYVTGLAEFNQGTGVTLGGAMISRVPNDNQFGVDQENKPTQWTQMAAGATFPLIAVGATLPVTRMVLTAESTVVYLVVYAQYASGMCAVTGRLSASAG